MPLNKETEIYLCYIKRNFRSTSTNEKLAGISVLNAKGTILNNSLFFSVLVNAASVFILFEHTLYFILSLLSCWIITDFLSTFAKRHQPPLLERGNGNKFYTISKSGVSC